MVTLIIRITERGEGLEIATRADQCKNATGAEIEIGLAMIQSAKKAALEITKKYGDGRSYLLEYGQQKPK